MNKNRSNIKGVLTSVFLLMILLSTNISAQAQSQAPSLFNDANGTGADSTYSQPAFVTRARYVNVNTSLLIDANGKAMDASTSPEIALNLFPNASFTGVINRRESNPGVSVSWIGTLKGMQNSYFYLVMAQGVFIAHVASPLGIYEVSSAGGNLYRVIQVDQSKLGEDAPGHMADPGPVLSPAAADLDSTADSGATIDVMVVYTTTARVAEGSVAAMKARIALAVTETNAGYMNSGVTPRLRLVHVEEVAYAESGNIGTDVARLANPADGFIDQIHTLRNTYAADMVSLVVENGGGYCGMADAIMATAATAFQVTARSGCMTGYYSFGHEFGHLQGARHDLYVDSGTTPYAYGHGYVHTSAVAAQQWRTIMAYNNKCSDLGYNCTRLQYWSNPTKVYTAAPMGVASSSENYKVLNATAFTVANFRTAIISGNFNSTFNTSSAGWTPVIGAWGLLSGAYYRTLGVASQGSSAVYSGTYGDLTYEAQMYRQNGTCTTCPNRLIIRGNPLSLDPTKWWKPSYTFQYANNGVFSVYKISSLGVFTALKPWTASAAIVMNGWNTLKVVAVGASLKFYINGTLVWTGADTSLRTGKVGLGMYRDAASTGNALYVNYATLSTTPTADLRADEAVAPGTELSGGDVDHAPNP